ncbi:MAG: TerC family protein [Hyphomicrobiales bacterium]|nr:TerC family protein [Hyphomicrobiales bacterium]
MFSEILPLAVPLLQIIWIDLLLSGDNAVVIALACRGLPQGQRRIGILLGTGVAIVLRIIFALIITLLLGIPYLKALGGVLLFWVAYQLISSDDGGHGEVEASASLWKAVRTIAIADAVMSLDNVLALAAASKGNVWLFTFGLVITIPLIIYGSQLILGLIERFPVFIWAGAALLGWIAGELIADDPGLQELLGSDIPNLLGASVGALLVVMVSYVIVRKRKRERGLAEGSKE